MCAWAHQESSFDIEAFPLSLYMSPPKLWKIAETNEYFADCVKFTRLMLYIRRSKRCSDRAYDNTWLIKSMPLYQEEYQTLVAKKWAEAGQALSGGKTSFTLCNCLKWPSTDQVKPRIEEDESM